MSIKTIELQLTEIIRNVLLRPISFVRRNLMIIFPTLRTASLHRYKCFNFF